MLIFAQKSKNCRICSHIDKEFAPGNQEKLVREDENDIRMAQESANEKRRRLDKLVRRELLKEDRDAFDDGWYISILGVLSYANPGEVGLVKMAQTRMGRVYLSERNGKLSWKAVPEGKSRFAEKVFATAREARMYVERECND